MNLQELNVGITMIKNELGSIAFERISMEQKAKRLKAVHADLYTLISDCVPFIGIDSEIDAKENKPKEDVEGHSTKAEIISNDIAPYNASNVDSVEEDTVIDAHIEPGKYDTTGSKSASDIEAPKKKRQSKKKNDETGEL